MPKLNYFDSLEHLSVLCTRSVFLACGNGKPSTQSELASLRASADKCISELEKALFSDFMPPLERSSIAECAHSLGRVMEKCTEISNYKAGKNFFAEKKNKEAELCIRLAQLTEENVFKLRRIKKPREAPDLTSFRRVLCEARSAHAHMSKKLSSGAYPKSWFGLLNLTGSLRVELANCFDRIIEIMLNNI